MKIEDIKPYEKNAKKHSKKQIEQVANSIKEFGFNQPIVVDKNNVVIVGHGRLEAAKLLGLSDVPTVVVDLNEEKAKAYRLADNKLNESDWDMDLAIEELKGLSEEMIDLTGFDNNELEARLKVDEINELSNQKDIDLGKYDVITVEAPEAPRLKARMSFYFEDIKDFEKAKKFFKNKGGELDTKKLLELI